MLKSYLKIAIRNIVKNRLVSAINILGLSIAFAGALVVFLFIEFATTANGFHEKKDRIFMIENIIDRNGNLQEWGDSPEAMGEALAIDFPQVEEFTRVKYSRAPFRVGEKVIEEQIQYVDPGFFNVFTFPLKSGNTGDLKRKESVYLTTKAAEKYFPTEEAVGKQVTITFQGNNVKEFVVAGVLEEIPNKSLIEFNILLNYEVLLELDERKESSWENFTYTFLLLDSPGSVNALNASKEKYIKLQNAASEDWTIKDFIFDPLMNVSRKSNNLNRNIAGGPPFASFVAMSVIGLFLLSLACFNYMIVAIGSSHKRLKEIGLRKVVGGLRSNLIIQFLAENIIVCFLAILLGVALAEFFLVPGFNSLIPVELKIEWNAGLISFITIVLLVTGIGSGAYPAFYVSSFQAVSIFRGKFSLGGKRNMTKVFLGFQFVFSFITFYAAMMFIQNQSYQKQQDWGYDESATIVIPVKSEEQLVNMRNEMMQDPNVISTAGSRSHIARSHFIDAIKVDEKQVEVQKFMVGDNYLQTLGIELSEGRYFLEGSEEDKTGSIIINEKMARNMNWDEPLGKRIVNDSVPYYVVGVVKDFHYDDFHNAIEPVIIRLDEEENFRFLSIRTEPGKAVVTREKVEDLWKAQNPDLPSDIFFQNEVFDEFFIENSSNSKIMLATSSMALFLACMGLFGLVTQNVAAKMKDYSIRKILGAGLGHIIKLINKDFIWILVLAMIIASPISYFMMKSLFSAIYKYYVPVSAFPFIVSALVLLVTALITVSSQIYKVNTHNPIESISQE